MDWVDARLDKFKQRLRNMSFRKAFLMYISLAAVAAVVASDITIVICTRLEGLKWLAYKDRLAQVYEFNIDRFSWYDWFSWSSLVRSFEGFSPADDRYMHIVDFIRLWCPFIYCFLGSVAAMLVFYRQRLKKPLRLLEDQVVRIKNQELDRPLVYDSRDEMGELCVLLDEMRRELVGDKERMWRLVDGQKKLNEAFAHDMRTPLTVLKGYTEFLYRYFPAGKLSQEKIADTLQLISHHLTRLEDFSKTMHGIRNMDERELALRATTVSELTAQIAEVLFALNQVGEIHLELLPAAESAEPAEPAEPLLNLDTNLILEVLENMLSNAIRYARTRIEVAVENCRDLPGVVLTVHDDGRGFSRKDLTEALLPYHKDPAEDSREHFGIGLHISTQLSRKHGGELNIANSISGGAMVSASFYSQEESIIS